MDDENKGHEVSEHVPDTPPAAPVDEVKKVEHSDDLRETVRKLEETVNALTEQVSMLTPDPNDSTPTKRPWTHRGGR